MSTRDHVPLRLVKVRWKMLAQFFDDLKPNLVGGISPSAEVKVDFNSLFAAVQSYLDDIDRFKVWHLRAKGRKKSRANCVKHAAYLTYWLNKVRPVIIVRPDPSSFDVADTGIMMNSTFAIVAGLNVINEYMDDEQKPYISLAPPILESLTYDLMFRQVTVAQLLSFFEIVFVLAAGNNVIEVET
jgi:hypothetical protein